MDTTNSSNDFLMIAEAASRQGEDMEEIARALAKALRAVIAEGFGRDDQDTVLAEVEYLLFGGSDAHRQPVDQKEVVK